MSSPFEHNATIYRSLSVSSDPFSPTIISPSFQYTDNNVSEARMYRTASLSSAPLSPVLYTTDVGVASANVVCDTVRYLVPIERRVGSQTYLLINNAPRVVSPVYLQKTQRYSISSLDDSDVFYQQPEQLETQLCFNRNDTSSLSQTPGTTKTSESSSHEAEAVVREESSGTQEESGDTVPPGEEPLASLDMGFFGVLLAEVYSKNLDIHSYVSEHMAEIQGRTNIPDTTIDYKVETEEVEALIPESLSELTKQQIRYLLQIRLTADKILHLLLTTFNGLRNQLVHLQFDIQRLETEKRELERDLSFRADQAQQYNWLLEALQESNDQLQVSLEESGLTQRSLETELLSSQNVDSERESRVGELERSLRTLEQENAELQEELSSQCTSPSFLARTEELSTQYNKMLTALREEKNTELKSLRAQLQEVQVEHTRRSVEEKSLQLRITELLATLEQRKAVVKQQEEDIGRLQQEKIEICKVITKTTMTNRNRNPYPLLGLLGDDFLIKSLVSEAETVTFESTEEMCKQEVIADP